MKRFLCLALALLLVLSSLMFVACDTVIDNENGSEQGGSMPENDTGTSTGTSTEASSGASTEEGSGTSGEIATETPSDDVTIVDNIAGKTAYEAYVASFETKHVNYTLKAKMSTISEYGESKTVSTVNAEVKLDGEKAYIVTSSPDTPYASGESWYAEGYLYTKSGEDKYKEELSFEDFLEYNVSEYSPSYDDLGLEKKHFEAAQIEQDKDGNYRISFDLSEELEDVFGEMEEEAPDSITVTLEIVFDKNGVLSETHINFGTAMEMDGIMVYSTNSWDSAISDVGTTTVTLPDDLDTYEEFDWGFDDKEEIPDMSDWTDEEIESWYESYWGDENEEPTPDMSDWTDEEIESWYKENS